MIVSTSELRAHVGADREDESFLVVQEEAARAFFQARTGLYLGAPVTVTEVLDGYGLGYFDLANPPREGVITSVSVRGATDSAWSAVSSSDYELLAIAPSARGRTRVVRFGGLGYWPAGTANIQAIYTAGYQQVVAEGPDVNPDDVRATDAPEIFRDFVRSFVETRFRRRAQKRPGPSSERSGGGALADLSDTCREILAMFTPVLIA
jgi:hypothetical protein